jgi:hypothetical protein
LTKLHIELHILHIGTGAEDRDLRICEEEVVVAMGTEPMTSRV